LSPLLQRDLLVEVAKELGALFEEGSPLLTLAGRQFSHSAPQPTKRVLGFVPIFGREQGLNEVKFE